MTPREEVVIQLSDNDFRDLVAEALADSVIKNYKCDLEVEDINWNDSWEIRFVQNEKEDE